MTKVLLVGNNCKYLKDAISLYGYEVVTVNNQINTLKFLKRNDIDIILLDVIMPNVDGMITLKAIREIHEYIPIIVLSSVNDDNQMVACLKAGADDYIVKPFILPNLLARMEAILRRTLKNKNKKIKMVSHVPLTSKEQQVLELASKGNSNKEIADKLLVKEVTIKTHLNKIFKKLKVSNRMQAVLANSKYSL